MTAIRSAIFNALFFGLTAITAIACLPTLLMPRAAIFRVSELWTGGTMRLLAMVCGLTYEVRGDQFRPRGAAIVAVKHQSAWETLVMPTLLRRPVYVLKQELLRIPVFGWYLRGTGQIAIDRGGGAGALRTMVAQARAALDTGRPLLIFPEGTRAAPGTTGTYNPGVAAIYNQTNSAVVPVALNSGLFWGRRAFQKRPGKIVIEFLPPIETDLPARDFLAVLEERVESATRRLEAEARAGSAGE